MNKLSKICISGYWIKGRKDEDLWGWYNGIDSLLRPTSAKALVKRNGEWEKCIVSGKVTYENMDYISLCIYFEDATCCIEKGSREYFLPEPMKNMKYRDVVKILQTKRETQLAAQAV